jgi:HK97 gp10 family phage protein
MIEIRVKGLKELNKVLQDLPAKVERNVLRGALAAGAKVVKKEVEANLHRNESVKTGELLRSVKVTTRTRRGRVIAAVRAGGKRAGVGASAHGYVAYWLEFTGAAAHVIKAKKAKFLFFGGRHAKMVMHPGFPPKPFMRPALQSKANEAILAAANHMKARLSKKFGLNMDSIEVRTE